MKSTSTFLHVIVINLSFKHFTGGSTFMDVFIWKNDLIFVRKLILKLMQIEKHECFALKVLYFIQQKADPTKRYAMTKNVKFEALEIQNLYYSGVCHYFTNEMSKS